MRFVKRTYEVHDDAGKSRQSVPIPMKFNNLMFNKYLIGNQGEPSLSVVYTSCFKKIKVFNVYLSFFILLLIQYV